MSGGHFDYKDSQLCEEIFGSWGFCPEYDIGSELQKKSSKAARKSGPFEDRIINELVYDVFCVIHSYDWYVSGDTSQDTYLRDTEAFKDKWLKPFRKDRVKAMIDDALEAERKQLYKDLGVEDHG